MSGYWFARRFPAGHPSKALAPVSDNGRIVAMAFVAGMAPAGIGFLLFAMSGQALTGVLVFAAVAGVSGAAFVMIARAKADPKRTVEDYRQMGRDV